MWAHHRAPAPGTRQTFRKCLRSERTASKEGSSAPRSFQKPRLRQGAQALPGSGLKPTGSPTPLRGLREGAPLGRARRADGPPPSPAFLVCGLFTQAFTAPGSRGAAEAGSGPRSRSVFTLCLPVSALTRHNTAAPAARGSGGLALSTPCQAARRGRAPEPGAPLAWTALPGLSFLCKPEQIK